MDLVEQNLGGLVQAWLHHHTFLVSNVHVSVASQAQLIEPSLRWRKYYTHCLLKGAAVSETAEVQWASVLQPGLRCTARPCDVEQQRTLWLVVSWQSSVHVTAQNADGVDIQQLLSAL